MKTIVVLGSTGSIGRSTLDVIRRRPREFKVAGLSACTNARLLEQQADEFGVDITALRSPAGSVPGQRRVITGETAAADIVAMTRPDIVVNGISGAAGFLPSLQAVRQGSVLALANKESLVIGGAFLTQEARRHRATLIPVDSEHSAVFQCLAGERPEEVSRIFLTASGGPFRTRPKETFPDITPEEALSHPTWSMGKRITIDSATMMNKGLEIIEAYWLFGVDLSRIQVVVHPQSIVHSMVEFRDMSIKAQLGVPDMRSAIAYALSWPSRMELDLKPLDPAAMKKLEFFPPDEDKFPALELARASMEQPRTLPCVMNAADETAVDGFLKRRIRFDGIIDIVRKTMDKLAGSRVSSPEDLIELDRESRKIAGNMIP
ncbi:MAG: 1-deoxy-D-xylulose 5-phosphate reductoisomerase [Deltaproteobacteria bacterium ADurb.BinA179]|jgi:1-deoxy-D-xylulose-5-phosphate reductoisomerase|nr:1-deoxy-D-xylulose-5-phosphate reductoisomerase [Deltaproteobacteria bacterium]MDI9542852.1 1-deoxy-D-xylulose-5-phosphate reductoisomerase [Pseudomonadota bacterium]OPZ25805.1 MAG: 1-deoxy-D-xylulose 5-phosphate reductoisomerase [Deltaproteobacteria bacterium ADurb.BinA179]HOD72407.1 1-deoxy-D-xylulose-5-phosphate reductoisomerase [Deltaproteobacteria bacterium]HOE73974.1 1-deoxy-D-xylulose-5-phosphate reductoisomerase [Deltaproteobacteria bacterium]